MPKAQLIQTVDLHRAQQAFCHGGALYRGFVGGRGAGKSFVGAYDLIRRAKPGRLYGVYAPSYPMMRDATQRTFLELARRFGYLREWRRSDNQVVLGNGAEVMFRSLDDPERARGPNLSGAWIDEASLVHQDSFNIIIAALREAGDQGWLSATFTPKGRSHWTYAVFGQANPNTELFRARTADNPFNPAGFAETLAEQYTTQWAAQELGGEFVELAGTLCQRQWFKIVDALPVELTWCRAWDFAATERSNRASDPDFTVGVKIGKSPSNHFYVAHVVRGRVGPGDVEMLVVQTATTDGLGVPILLEQEPGSGGKIFTAAMVKRLAGWNISAAPAQGDKVTRAMPFLAQAQAGNVSLLRAGWNEDYLDEFSAFPGGVHDDQVDASSGAFNRLTLRPGMINSSTLPAALSDFVGLMT